MNSATKRERDTMGEPRLITITTDGAGSFTYDPSTVYVRDSESIQWTSGKLGPFAISFNDFTPFDEVTVYSETDDNGNNVTPPQEIVEGRVGHHHYSVAIALLPRAADETVKVALDSGCPDIVVSS